MMQNSSFYFQVHHTHSAGEATRKYGLKRDKTALTYPDELIRDSYGNPVTPYTTLSTADITLSTVPVSPTKSVNKDVFASTTNGPHGVITFKLPSYAGGITQITGPYKEPTGKPLGNVQLPFTDLLPPLDVATVRADDEGQNTNKNNNDDKNDKKITASIENEIPDSSPTSDKIGSDDKSVTNAPNTNATYAADAPLPVNDLLPPLIRPSNPRIEEKATRPAVSSPNAPQTQAQGAFTKPTSVPLKTITTTTATTTTTTKQASKDAEHIPLPINELLPPIETTPANAKPQNGKIGNNPLPPLPSSPAQESTTESNTEKPIQKYSGGFGGAPGILGDSNKRGYAIREDGSVDLTGTPARPATINAKIDESTDTKKGETLPTNPTREPSTESRIDKPAETSPQISIESGLLAPLASSPAREPSAESEPKTEKPIRKYSGGFGGAPGILGNSNHRGYAVREDGSIDPTATPLKPALTTKATVASTKLPTITAAPNRIVTTAPTKSPTAPHTTKKSLSLFDTTSEPAWRSSRPTVARSSTLPTQFNSFGTGFGNADQQNQYSHSNGFGVGTSSSASSGPQGTFTSQSHYNFDPTKPLSNNNGFQFGQQFIPNYSQNPFLNANNAFPQSQGQNDNANSQQENASSGNANEASQLPSNAPNYSQNPFLNPNGASGQGQGQNGNANAQNDKTGNANQASQSPSTVPNFSQNPFLNPNSASAQGQGQKEIAPSGNPNVSSQSPSNAPNYSQNPFLNPNSGTGQGQGQNGNSNAQTDKPGNANQESESQPNAPTQPQNPASNTNNASPPSQGSNSSPNSQNSNGASGNANDTPQTPSNAPNYSQNPFQNQNSAIPQGQGQNGNANAPNNNAGNANQPSQSQPMAPNRSQNPFLSNASPPNQGQNSNVNSPNNNAAADGANAQSQVPSNSAGLNNRLGANGQQPSNSPSSPPKSNNQNGLNNEQPGNSNTDTPYTGIFGGPGAHASGASTGNGQTQPIDPQNKNNAQGGDSNQKAENAPNDDNPSQRNQSPSPQANASPNNAPTPVPTSGSSNAPPQAQNTFPNQTPFNQPYSPFANNPFINRQQFPNFAQPTANGLFNNNGMTAQPAPPNVNNNNQNSQPSQPPGNSNSASLAATPNRANVPSTAAEAQKPPSAGASTPFAPSHPFPNNPFLNQLSLQPFLPPFPNSPNSQAPFQISSNNPFIRPNNQFSANKNQNQGPPNASNGTPAIQSKPSQYSNGSPPQPQNNNFGNGNSAPSANPQGADASKPPTSGGSASQSPFQNIFTNGNYRPQTIPFQGFPSFQPFPGFQFHQPNTNPFLPPVESSAQNPPANIYRPNNGFASTPLNNNNANANPNRKLTNKYTGGFGGPPGVLSPYDGKGKRQTSNIHSYGIGMCAMQRRALKLICVFVSLFREQINTRKRVRHSSTHI